jgi:hypothetical protein
MSTVFDLLDAEWRQLCTSRSAARRLADVCALTGARSLAELEGHVRAAAPEDADRVLLALVRRSVVADDTAARVLLQLLLPGTRNLARRWWALGDVDERAAAAVAAVYHRIRNYPLANRPGKVAANVLLDAARELRRSVPKVVAIPSADPTVGGGAARAAAAPVQAAASEELAAVLRDAVADGVIDDADAALIARTRIAGHRVADIAADQRLSTRALWHRRQRAEDRLAAGGATATRVA